MILGEEWFLKYLLTQTERLKMASSDYISMKDLNKTYINGKSEEEDICTIKNLKDLPLGVLTT